MDIKRLKYFVDLARTLNYTDTAEINFTTQSNISKHIMSLEKELDVKLFSREHRKVSLTKEGVIIKNYAEKILNNYEDLNREIFFLKKSREILRIAVVPTMKNSKVTEVISKFHKLYEEVTLDVKEIESINLLEELCNNRCDVAYARTFETSSKKYDKIKIEEQEFSVILPKEHILAKKRELKLCELEKENFMQLGKNTRLIDLFYETCKKAGFVPKVGYIGIRMDNILEFISQGMGISLMMENTLDFPSYPGVVIKPIDIKVRSELAFVRCKKDKHSIVSQKFWNYLINYK